MIGGSPSPVIGEFTDIADVPTPYHWEAMGSTGGPSEVQEPIGGHRYPFVGRASELGRLTSWRSDASSRVAAICGQPGVGKSRLLQEFLALVPPSGVVRLIGSDDASVQPLEQVATAFWLPATPRRTTDRESGADARFRLHEQVLDIISERAAHSPLLIAADDAQWLGAASLELLVAATCLTGTAPVRLVLAHRPIVAVDDHRRILDDADLRIDLTGLDDAAVRDLIEFATGSSPSAEDLIDVRTARGNPLLTLQVVQLKRTAADPGESSNSHDPLAQLRSRLDADARRTATAAAVIGRRFKVDDVMAILGSARADAAAACAALLRHDIVVAVDHQTLSFRHDLLRETFLETAPPAVLADLHRRRAAVLTELQGGADAVVVARHLVAAGEATSTTPWLIAAGRTLLESDPGAAAEFLLGAMPASSAPDVELLVAVAQALTRSSRADEALDLLDQHGAADHPDVLVQRAQARAAMGEMSVAAALFEAAAAVVDDAVASQRWIGEAQLLRAFAFDFTAAEHTSRELLATPGVDPLAAVHAGCALGWVQQHRGEIDEAIATLSDAVERAGEDPDCLWRNPAMHLLGACIAGDRLGDLAEHSQRARRIAIDHGDIWQVPALSSMLAGAHFRTGEWDRAIAEIDAGRSWADLSGNQLALPWLLSLRSVISSRRGQLGEAETDLAIATASLDADTRTGFEAVAWAEAWFRWSAGEPDRAFDGVDQLWELMRAIGVLNRTTVIVPMLARLALDVGDRARCIRLVGELELLEDGSRSLAGLAPVRTLLDGLMERNPAKLSIAAEGFGELLLVPDQVDAMVDLVDVCSPSGLRSHAAQISDTLEKLRTLRAGPRLDQLTARLPGPMVSVERESSDPLGRLTEAERRIAELVATGASNPEIADRLFISRRTVESHLSHIFKKIDVSSRVELALIVAGG